MNFFDYIRDWFIWATQVLVYAAMEAYDWPLVGTWLGNAFRDLSDFTARVSGYLFDASNWYDYVWSKIQNILTTEGVLGLLKWWFPWLEDVGSWFADRWNWFITSVGNWWETTKLTVLGWIDIAKTAVLSIIDTVRKSLASLQTTWDNFWTLTWPQWTSQFNSLATAWDNFWKITLPTLITGKAAADLIISTLKTWFPFYDDLVKLWSGIKLFFTDPEEWLYKAADRIIERFW